MLRSILFCGLLAVGWATGGAAWAQSPSPAGPETGPSAAPAAAPGAVDPLAVVARVEGPDGVATVTAGRLAAYAATQPGRTAAELVEELVAFELLAARAAKAGLAEHPEVEAATAQALVRVSLGRDFGPRYTDEALPFEHVEAAYELNRAMFVHPELREGAHLLVAGPKMKRPQDPALDAEARALAERLAADLRAETPADLAAFATRVQALLEAAKAAGLPAGLEAKVESLGRFTARGPFVPEFNAASFALPAKTVGAPFATEFGWHVVWIEEITPAKNQPIEAVEAEIRPRIGPEVRQHAFRQLTDGLARTYDAGVNLAPLEELARRLQQPVGVGAGPAASEGSASGASPESEAPAGP